jgi:hypothetical protein
VLKFGASTDDVCAGCGRRGHVAWISGEMAVAVREREAQPRIVGMRDLSLARRPRTPRTFAWFDLYLCGRCLAAAAALTPRG